jgi:hypothetical protein
VRQFAIAAFLMCLTAIANAAPIPSPVPSNAVIPPLYVTGQVLTIAAGYCIFTTGDAVRVDPGVAIPRGITTGSIVHVTIDQVSREIVAIDRGGKIVRAGEIDAANVPRQYVVVSPKSAPLPAPSGQPGANTSGPVTVTIVVHVPGNTPTSDVVYLSTDRSSFSSAEIPMQRVDGTTFRVAVTLPANTAMKYVFTRGTYSTVERDRTGGIVAPRTVNAIPNTTTDDTVARWADLT